MSSIYWRSNRSGDWTDAQNWLGGVPGAGDDAFLRGRNFAVTLSTEQAVANLTVSGAGVVLNETASGSLDLAAGGLLTIANGAVFTVAGHNSNLAGDLLVVNATLSLAGGSDLGTGTLNVDRGTVEVGGSVQLQNQSLNYIDYGYSVTPADHLEVADGATLTLGSLNVNGSLQIGDAAHHGTVQVFNLTVNGSLVELAGGTLSLSPLTVANFDYATLVIDAGATLDLGGGLLVASALENGGTITSSAGTGVIDLTPGFSDVIHGGTITGNVLVTTPGPGSFPVPVGPTLLDGNLSLSGGGIGLSGGTLVLSGTLTVAKPATIMLTDAESGSPAKYGSYLDIRSSFSISGNTTIEGFSSLAIEGAGTISGTIKGTPDQFASGGSVAILGSGTVTLSGAISGVSLFMGGTGTLVLSHANDLLGFTQAAGTTQITTAAAFGTGSLELDGGVLISTVSGKLANDIYLGGAGTIAAAHGKTIDLTGILHPGNIDESLIVGAVAGKADGTVVFDLGGDTSNGNPGETLHVAAGTLRLGAASNIQDGLSLFSTVELDARTKLDVRGRSVLLTGLVGDGSVTNTGSAGATLALAGASFDGLISGGKLALEITSDPLGNNSPLTVLTRAETYGGGTTIDAGAGLVLADGGSVKGAIVDNGALQIDQSRAVTLANAISGSGELDQIGSGTTTVTAADSYTGGTHVEAGTLVAAAGAKLGTGDVTVDGGVLQTGSAAALGSGVVHLAGGELLFTASATLNGTLDLVSGSTSTVAAADGTTLTVASNLVSDGARIELGDGGNDGTVVLAFNSLSLGGGFGLVVENGTARLGNATAAAALDGVGYFGIFGGTFDLAGQSATTGNLHQYGGVLTNTGAAATLTLAAGENLSYGPISGAISIVAATDATFGGAGSFSSLTISGAHVVTIGGAASEQVVLADQGATLALGAGAKLTGHVAGFGDGDMLDLQAVGYSGSTRLSYNETTHVLRATDGTNVVTLTLDGSYTRASFALSNDGSGHALVSFATAGAPLPPADFAHAAASAFAPGQETALAFGLDHALHVLSLGHELHPIL